MRIAVFDTYVKRKDGKIMHFDVFVPENTDAAMAIKFGREYLSSVNEAGQTLTSKECQFCHVEHAPKTIEEEIKIKGYYIYEMEGCPKK
jgi:hypothetical protein